MAREKPKGLERFSELSLTISRKDIRDNSKKICSIKVNGEELGDIVAKWKIEQEAGGLPNLVLTIPLHDVPQILM